MAGGPFRFEDLAPGFGAVGQALELQLKRAQDLQQQEDQAAKIGFENLLTRELAPVTVGLEVQKSNVLRPQVIEELLPETPSGTSTESLFEQIQQDQEFIDRIRGLKKEEQKIELEKRVKEIKAGARILKGAATTDPDQMRSTAAEGDLPSKLELDLARQENTEEIKQTAEDAALQQADSEQKFSAANFLKDNKLISNAEVKQVENILGTETMLGREVVRARLQSGIQRGKNLNLLEKQSSDEVKSTVDQMLALLNATKPTTGGAGASETQLKFDNKQIETFQKFIDEQISSFPGGISADMINRRLVKTGAVRKRALDTFRGLQSPGGKARFRQQFRQFLPSEVIPGGNRAGVQGPTAQGAVRTIIDLGVRVRNEGGLKDDKKLLQWVDKQMKNASSAGLDLPSSAAEEILQGIKARGK
jgi:hypothetical protein